VKTLDNLPPLRNPDILLGENDLTSLSYLHEPAGTIVVRNNPFQSFLSRYQASRLLFAEIKKTGKLCY